MGVPPLGEERGFLLAKADLCTLSLIVYLWLNSFLFGFFGVRNGLILGLFPLLDNIETTHAAEILVNTHFDSLKSMGYGSFWGHFGVVAFFGDRCIMFLSD